jgi:thiol-disulfide isomerase/thioredoxin
MSWFGVRRHPGATPLPTEGRIPGFGGATGWLNSPPLTAEDLAGRVVLVDFWTYTCINWLRTLAYVRGWAEKYREAGLVVVGVHTPEFQFEHELENVREAARAQRVDYPIALDSDYRVWRAFGNRYWPAVYIVDAEGRIRQHHFGEGEYDECEWAIQMLLREAGAAGIGDDLVSVEPEGLEAQADWTNLRSPETYVGTSRPGTSRRRRGSRSTSRAATRLRIRCGSTSGRSPETGRSRAVRASCTEPRAGSCSVSTPATLISSCGHALRVRACRSACSSTESHRVTHTGSTSTSRAAEP